MTTKANYSPILSYIAGAALVSRRIVKQAADRKVIYSTDTVNDVHLGVTDHDSVVDRPVDVIVRGEVSIEAGGAITVGASIKSNATGKAVVAATGNHRIGFATSAAEDGGTVRVILMQGIA